MALPEKLKDAPIKTAAALLLGFVAVTWAIEIIDLLPGLRLDAHGIHPRSIDGLSGIVLAPFLHGDFAHLSANTGSFLILGAILFISQGAKRFVLISVSTALLAGLGVWIFGRAANHIGASAMIFGYFGYLLVYGFFRRSWQSIAVSLGIGAVYGGLIFGVMPNQPGISWEGHLFGFLAGAILAVLLGRKERVTSSPT